MDILFLYFDMPILLYCSDEWVKNWYYVFTVFFSIMLFSFKQKSQDFIVEESLPFKLSGKGDAFFVYFEKRNLTTMDIIDFLCKELNISRLTLWFAGLKDKDAITRQWVSIYKSALKKMWWEKVFLETLAQKARIISTDRHDKPIGMTNEIHNTFFIRLRALKKLSQTEKIETEKTISKLFAEWFSNVFGSQRFGIQYQNIKLGKELLDGTLKIKEKFEVKFKLQAYASRLFNEYVLWRVKKWLTLLDGEIVELDDTGWAKLLWYYDAKKNIIQTFKDKHSDKDFFHYPSNLGETIPFTSDLPIHITGPVLGFDLLMPLAASQAGQKEKALFDNAWLKLNNLKLYKINNIFGIRRRMRTRPQKAKYRFDNDDVLIEFTLDSWVYASILIDKLLKSFK